MYARRQRLAAQRPRQAFATMNALTQARDLMSQRGMHGRARTLTQLAELVAKARSSRLRARNAAETIGQQMRPSGARSEAF